MTKFVGPSALVAAICGLSALGATAGNAIDCAPTNGAVFICGVDNVEDFVRLPSGQILGSDLAQTGTQGHFFLFDPNHSFRTIRPEEIAVAHDADAYGDCPDAPDWSQFGPHGIDFAMTGDRGTLLAVNHGGREAIEAFSVQMTGNEPNLTWVGCVIAPAGAWPDDVAILPEGGCIATSLWDPADESRVEKLSTAQSVGGLFEWHPSPGWKAVAGSDVFSGPNGVIVTPDGSRAYIAAWSGKQIATLDRKAGVISTIDVDFPADNLVWAADGRTILVGGIHKTVPDALACFGSTKVNCPEIGVHIARFHPDTGQVETLVRGNGFGQFGAATGAIDVGDELWVNSFRSDRVAIFPLK